MKLRHSDDQSPLTTTQVIAHLKDDHTDHDIAVIDINGTKDITIPASYYVISGSGQIVANGRIETLEPGTLAHSNQNHTIEGDCRIVQFHVSTDENDTA